MPAPPWRETLTQWEQQCLNIFQRHPWLLSATATPRRLMGTHELSWLDAALRPMSGLGLTEQQQHDFVLTLLGHIRITAQFADSPDPTGVTWATIMTKQVTRSPEDHPALAATAQAGAFEPHDRQRFDFGLTCLLDGLHQQTCSDGVAYTVADREASADVSGGRAGAVSSIDPLATGA
ncbi:MAG: TetR/AcrR family transcriptional regulator C-terminal domain-containing protein [Actinomycetota bacterium]|nr:TetR/AcrR family transcriptional regulator C-terminal domain-containing protein [Actinomycetota bacterium]